MPNEGSHDDDKPSIKYWWSTMPQHLCSHYHSDKAFRIAPDLIRHASVKDKLLLSLLHNDDLQLCGAGYGTGYIAIPEISCRICSLLVSSGAVSKTGVLYALEVQDSKT